MMKLSQLDAVTDLQARLQNADRVLDAFESQEGEYVPCQALAPVPLYGGRAEKVELLPVPKEVAVSAARRERNKVVQMLAALGVEVDSQESAS